MKAPASRSQATVVAWTIRQGYRDPSTWPPAAGVAGILDSRRDQGCCAASRIDRLR
jgi:hypothetical protein